MTTPTATEQSVPRFSLGLGRAFGIQITIHWSFLILVAWIVISNISRGAATNEILMSLLFVGAIFACITLHELGHALAARGYGIQTRGITLLPIGGVASLEKIPEKPREELWVAVAGPLVNVGIAAVLYAGWAVFAHVTGGIDMRNINLGSISAANFVPMLIVINLWLVVFNMIPAFPMDGGRVLRALLGFRMSREQATEWAVRVGQVFAILFVFWGLFNNPFLLLIAVFIFLSAQGELQHVKSQSLLEGYTVADATMHKYHTLHPFTPLSKAVELLLNGQDQHFLVAADGQIHGVLSKNDMIRGLAEQGDSVAIRQLVSADNMPRLEAGMPLQEAQELMMMQGATVAPVMQDGQLIGLLDTDNLQEFMLVRAALRRQA